MTSSSDFTSAPFAGLLVLELASVLAGPSVGQFFAELGARVIKVENLATNGDVTRKWRLNSETAANDRPAYFTSANWGKQSVAIDIREPAGLQLVHQLAAKADVVIASYKPGDAKKLGVSYQQLSALNPKLIYGEITGYGQHVNRAGYDAVLQAESGFMHINGQPDGPPTKMPVALIDILAGHQLKEGILTALYKRENTGLGDLVQVSLLHAAVASLANQAANYLVAGHNPQRLGSEHPNIVPYGAIYTTQDGKQLTLAVGDDRQFAALCQQLGEPGLAADARFLTNAARVKNRHLLQPLLEEAIGRFALAPLLQSLIDSHVPAGAVNDVATALANPHIQNILLTPQNNADEGLKGVATVAFQAEQFNSETKLLPPPHFAEHTDAVLGELLSLSGSEIRELKEARVIA